MLVSGRKKRVKGTLKYQTKYFLNKKNFEGFSRPFVLASPFWSIVNLRRIHIEIRRRQTMPELREQCRSDGTFTQVVILPEASEENSKFRPKTVFYI